MEIKKTNSILKSKIRITLKERMPRETMVLSVINKINSKLKFLYLKNKFLTPTLRQLLFNALIQSHFDYACSTWYFNLRIEKRMQNSQKKCIHFCLTLCYIGPTLRYKTPRCLSK